MKLQNTEMEFVAFDAQDVIATSNTPVTLTFSGIQNEIKGDAKIVGSNGITYYDAKDAALNNQTTLYTNLSTLFGANISGSTEVKGDYYTPQKLGDLLSTTNGRLFFADTSSGAPSDAFNGTFEWLDTYFSKVKQ